jgi:hypothetical protein
MRINRLMTVLFVAPEPPARTAADKMEEMKNVKTEETERI